MNSTGNSQIPRRDYITPPPIIAASTIYSTIRCIRAGGLAPLLLVANLVHGDAGIAARLSLGAMRPFRFCRAAA